MYNRLRELRLERGLVQAEVAVKAGLSPATVGNIERYGFPSSASTRERIAAVLGVDVADIWPPLDEPAVA